MICEKVKPFGGNMKCQHPENQRCKPSDLIGMVKNLTEIWATKRGTRTELRIDFDNDRHHAMVFDQGDSRDLVASKLEMYAEQLRQDKQLDT